MLVEFESYVFGEDKYRGEVELYVDVEAEVTADKDGYGTGDSPTLYEVNIKSVVLRSDNTNITKELDQTDIEYFTEQAIEIASEVYDA